MVDDDDDDHETAIQAAREIAGRHSVQAVEILVAIMIADGTPVETRLKAAQTILEACGVISLFERE
jgi:hypothetical protein